VQIHWRGPCKQGSAASTPAKSARAPWPSVSGDDAVLGYNADFPQTIVDSL